MGNKKSMNKLNDIDGLFKNNFDGFKVEPSSAVWGGVKYKLWISSFMKFSVGSINIYYSAILLSAIIGSTTLLLSEENINNELLLNDKINIEQVETIADNINLSNTKSIKLNEITETQLKTSDEVESNKSAINSSEYIVQIKSDVDLNSIPESTVVNDKKVLHNIASKEIVSAENKNPQAQTSEVINENIRTSSDIDLKLEEVNIDDINDEVVAEKQLQQSSIPGIEKQESDVFFDSNNELSGKINQLTNEIYFDTIIIYDTIPVYDTLFIAPEKKYSKGNWSFEVGVDAMNTRFDYNSDSNTELADKMNLASSLSVGYGFGGKIGYSINKWELQTGLSYLQVTESFSYNQITENVNTTEFWNYFPSGVEHTIDTLNWQFIFDLDDSSYVYVPIIHETTTTLFDSTLITLTDSSSIEKTHTSINNYSYLEIPFMIGYELFRLDNMTVGARLGGRIGIFIDAKGKVISSEDNLSVIDFDKNSLPFMMTKIDVVVGLPIYFEIRKGLGIVFEPYYRSGLNSIYNADHILSTSTGGIGLHFGLKFEF